uniref:MSP domain-containing protein n=1 Tax=Steinernema glaseri TaxID=37863 RepID=A0A1I7YPL4_9BILA
TPTNDVFGVAMLAKTRFDEGHPKERTYRFKTVIAPECSIRYDDDIALIEVSVYAT